MVSRTWWTGVWVGSGSWWWTGKPGCCSPWGHIESTGLSNWIQLIKTRECKFIQAIWEKAVYSFVLTWRCGLSSFIWLFSFPFTLKILLLVEVWCTGKPYWVMKKRNTVCRCSVLKVNVNLNIYEGDAYLSQN